MNRNACCGLAMFSWISPTNGRNPRPDVYLEVQRPCWSCNSSSLSRRRACRANSAPLSCVTLARLRSVLRCAGPAMVVSARPRARLQPFRPVGLVLVGREPRVAFDLPADRRGVAAGHQTDPADAGAVADLDLDDLAFPFRQVRIYFPHRCNIPSDWLSGQSPI